MTSSSDVAMRDLSKAKEAYDNNDLEASKAAHANKTHVEDHSKVGGRIKSVVFGGLDGEFSFFKSLRLTPLFVCCSFSNPFPSSSTPSFHSLAVPLR